MDLALDGFPTKDYKIEHEEHEMEPYYVYILCDLSGSMTGQKVEQLQRALIVLAEALNSAGIKFKIAGYSGPRTSYAFIDSVDSFYPIKVEDQLTVNDREIMGALCKYPNSSTPTGRALFAILEHIKSQPINKKLVLLLTDGGATDNECDYVLKQYRQENILVIGVAIGGVKDLEAVQKTTKLKLCFLCDDPSYLLTNLRSILFEYFT